jgi:hypothetical protein
MGVTGPFLLGRSAENADEDEMIAAVAIGIRRMKTS